MDCVDEEFGGDARFLLVLAKTEQSHTRDDHHRRIGIAEFGRVRLGTGIVVALVLGAILNGLILNAYLERGQVFLRWIPINEQRTDSGPQEVIRTTGS